MLLWKRRTAAGHVLARLAAKAAPKAYRKLLLFRFCLGLLCLFSCHCSSRVTAYWYYFG